MNRRSNSIHQEIWENHPDPMIYHEQVSENGQCRPDYVVVAVNRAFEKMMDLNKDLILGLSLREIFGERKAWPVDWAQLYSELEQPGDTATTEQYLVGTLHEIRAIKTSDISFLSLFRPLKENSTGLALKNKEGALFKLLSVLDGMDILVHVADTESHEILFINKMGREMYGDVMGKTCWEVFWGRDGGPCSFCPLEQLLRSDATSEDVYLWQRFNQKTGRWFEYRDQIIPWQDGKEVRLQMALDITDRKEMEHSLQASQGQLEMIINSIPGIVYLKDQKGQYFMVNDYFEDALGVNRNDIMGKNDFEVFPSAIAQSLHYRDDEVLKGAKTLSSFEDAILHADGTTHYYLTTKVPLHDKDGTVYALCGLMVDITDLKDTEEALRIKNQAIEASLNAIAMADLKGVLTYVNPAFLKLWGYRKEEEVLGQSVLDFWQDRDGAQAVCDAIMEKGEYTGELLGKKADGNLIYTHLSASMVYDGEGQPVMMMASFIDVTQRKRGERRIAEYTEELQELYAQLEAEVSEATKLHESKLPRVPEIPGLSLAAYYHPARRLGGDFYNFIKVGNSLILYLSDVTGHGMEGALFNAFVKEAIDSYITLRPHDIEPDAILRHLDHQYRKESYPEDYFIGIFLAILDLTTMELRYTGAGFQDLPLMQLGNGDPIELMSRGLPITSAVPSQSLDFVIGRITLTPGTTILFNTDGLTEQETENGPYGERLAQVFFAHSHLTPHEILKAVNQDFHRANGGSLDSYDDITFVVLQVQQ